jgi:hypothetical protein
MRSDYFQGSADFYHMRIENIVRLSVRAREDYKTCMGQNGMYGSKVAIIAIQ